MTLAEWLLEQVEADESRIRQCELVNGVIDYAPRPRTCYCHATTQLLAQCKATRRIVELSQKRPDSRYPNTDDAYADGLEEAVRLLALPYADRPGYDESWRP